MAKRVLGIIGGGQLGMMIAEAARESGAVSEHVSKVIVLDPTRDCPAAQAGAEQIVADFKDRDSIVELADRSDIITYEIESGDSRVLKSLEGRAEINPSPETLGVIQDKLLQKRFLSGHGMPVADFVPVGRDGGSGAGNSGDDNGSNSSNSNADGNGGAADDIGAALDDFGYPSLLKARRDAYDGRGNYLLESEAGIQKALDYFGARSLMLERFVPFRMEVSVIAARNTKGQIRTYPLVENVHEDNILRQTIAPARVSRAVAERAEAIADETLAVLGGAGVFGIEMFVTRDDRILINEIAPRVHNSGHHTLQSSETSQFEQHLRAILGLELGGTKLVRPAVMYNVLGSRLFEGEYAPPSLDGEPGAFLKMYGKKISKPLRKLGHLNLVASREGESTDSLLGRLGSLKPGLEVTRKS